MFQMNQKMMETLLKSQLKNLKKVNVEIEKNSGKKACKITDHKIQQGLATLYLKDIQTGEDFKLHFSI
ncbi:MAG: hypothetical protein OXC37_05775 [Bdellovibrionaceae bacterium]|nr:hypothetical protein [Pseudobdellovibrionaceae bacterium]